MEIQDYQPEELGRGWTCLDIHDIYICIDKQLYLLAWEFLHASINRTNIHKP